MTMFSHNAKVSQQLASQNVLRHRQPTPCNLDNWLWFLVALRPPELSSQGAEIEGSELSGLIGFGVENQRAKGFDGNDGDRMIVCFESWGTCH